jgi:hypothetical protein
MAPTYAQGVLKWARYYAELGMIPIPCYGLQLLPGPDGQYRCTCYKGGACTDPGKHPIGEKWNSVSAPQAGVKRVEKEMVKQPNLNLAILTGNSGLLVVDLDVKPDKNTGEFIDGLANFLEIVGNQDFPEAPHQHSGGGGHHFFLQIPIDPAFKTKNLGKGVEFKTDRSLIHVYPSRHKSGGAYRWDPVPSFKLLPPPCPEWIMARSREQSGPKGSNGEQVLTVTSEELQKLAKKWSSSQTAGVEKQRNGRALEALVNFSPQKVETGARIKAVLPDGSRLALLQLMGSLSLLYAQIKAECVLESLKPGIEWRCSQGHSTGYADLVQMLRDSQRKALVQRNGWRRGLIQTEAGKLQSCTSNAYLLLRHHPDWEGVLAFDIRNMNTVFLKQPPYTETVIETFPHQIDDRDVVMISQWFALQGGAISKAMIGDVLDAAAYGRAVVDPVKDYYETLVWDDTPRLDYWLHDYAGVEDSRYTQRVGATYLISAVARTYLPGCKVDHVLVFEGAQGFQKSTLLESLVPNHDWISDSKIDLDSKDGKMMLTGRLFIELSELSSVKRASVELVKNFITGKVDDYRPPYERKVTRVPRRSVFAASTNEEHYLVDDTGDRRFWPIRCGATDLARVAELVDNRDQIWAEAVHRFKNEPADPEHLCLQTGGEKWWLTFEEEALARIEQDKRSEAHDDPWLGEFLDDWAVALVKDAPGAPVAAKPPGQDAFATVDDPSKRMILHDGHFAYTHELLKLRGERLGSGTSKRLRRIAKILGWVPGKDAAGARGYSLSATKPARTIERPPEAHLRLVASAE